VFHIGFTAGVEVLTTEIDLRVDPVFDGKIHSAYENGIGDINVNNGHKQTSPALSILSAIPDPYISFSSPKLNTLCSLSLHEAENLWYSETRRLYLCLILDCLKCLLSWQSP
jgi:hypothetical protein